MTISEDRRLLSAEFARTVTMGPDRVLQVSDQIQDLARRRPELVALCRFGRSLEVRRLKTLAPANWNATDWYVAQQVLDDISGLRSEQHKPENALGLAVLGVEAPALENALSLLAKPVNSAGDMPAEVSRPPERKTSGRK